MRTEASGAVDDALRGGSCHQMVLTTVGGKLPPSTCQARAAAYNAHRQHVVKSDMTPLDSRFDKISRSRMAAPGKTSMDQSGECQVPYARSEHCFPHYTEQDKLSVAAMEGQMRAAAADLSVAFLSALPGVHAASMVQNELRAAEQSMIANPKGCPFVGASTHLYTKGSMGLMATKKGHDDQNGPASACVEADTKHSSPGAVRSDESAFASRALQDGVAEFRRGGFWSQASVGCGCERP